MNEKLHKIITDHIGKISDKWSLYIDEYERLFYPYQDQKISLLEIGVQNGGSLDIWAKYFFNAEKIFGIDIDPSCAKLSFDDPRIYVFIDDAKSFDYKNQELLCDTKFDIVIDDGSHIADEIILSFIKIISQMNDDSLYIVEDLHCSYWENFGGSLYSPYSPLSFFKRIADIINFEHWRTGKSRKSFLQPYITKFGGDISEQELSRIHSVEFINSMCIVKFHKVEKNLLGKRVIIGEIENVTNGWKKLQESSILENISSVKNEEELDVFSLVDQVKRLQNEKISLEKEFTNRISHIQKENLAVKKEISNIQSAYHDLMEDKKKIEKLSSDSQQELFEEISKMESLLLDRENILLEFSKNWIIRFVFSLKQKRILLKSNNFKENNFRRLIKALLSIPQRVKQNLIARKHFQLIKDSSLFDEEWYISHYSDVLNSLKNPIYHYLIFGGFEGRDPGPSFSSNYYFENNPDVKYARMNPLLHYLLHGKEEGRIALKEDFSLKPKVGIIIVSHNASNAVSITLSSFRLAKNNSPFKLILIDNASDPKERKKIKQVFDKYSNFGFMPWEFVQLDENRGFAGGNNLGIEILLRDEHITHFCLLNSDVIVTDYWLDRLIYEDIDMISPVTNRADSPQRVPFDINITFEDALYEKKDEINPIVFKKINKYAQDWNKAWKGNLVSVKEGVTFFCVVLSRKSIVKTGLLDQTFFPGGYEDNDYCARVMQEGGKIVLARDVFIFHFGSASFGRLDKEYFNTNAIKNRKYLENKHNFVLKFPFQSPFLSFSQDIQYMMNGLGNKNFQRFFIKLYLDSLTGLIEHYYNENISLRENLNQSDRKIPESLKEILSVSSIHLNIRNDWQKIIKKIDVILGNSLSSENQKEVIENLISVAEGAYHLLYSNIKMVEFIYDPLFPTSKLINKTQKRTFQDYLRLLKKGIIIFLKLSGIVFFGGYPYPERENDGYFQRIKMMDSHFKAFWRIYIERNPLPGREKFFDKPAPNTLVIQISGTKLRKLLGWICSVVCILRMGNLYFHSILAIGNAKFLLKLPGIKKILDIHGVVPEEFQYYEDNLNYENYNVIERYAFSKINIFIVVTESMKQHFVSKYKLEKATNFITIPIFQNIPIKNNRAKEVVQLEKKQIVVYAGGLQKWQLVPKMIEAIQKTSKYFYFYFFCPNPDEFKKMLPQDFDHEISIRIEKKSFLEVLELYEDCDFGFLLRENSIVNRVACPTKMIEYIAFGIIPIMEFENIGDLKMFGLRFIELHHFLQGEIPSNEELIEMRKKNFDIFLQFQSIYHIGISELKKNLNLNEPAEMPSLEKQ